MIAIIVLSLVVAIANFLDIFTDIFAITVAGISALQLGLLNGVAYLLFILAMYLGGKLSDRGTIRSQTVLVFICLLVYGALLWILNTNQGLSGVALITLYVFYSIAQALARTSAIAYIHEAYSSTYWKSMLNRRIVTTVAFEAFSFILVSLIGLKALISSLEYFAVLLAILAFTALLIVKDPPLKIERTLYVIDSGLRRVERLITGNLVVFALLTERGGLRRTNSYPLLLYASEYKYVSVRRILLSLALFRAANALILVQFPVYLRTAMVLSSEELFTVYGLARLFLLIDFFAPLTISGRVSVAMITRGLLPVLLLATHGLAPMNVVAALVLGAILYINSKVDVALYSMYTDSLGRAEATRYLVVGEMAGFICTLASGLVYSVGGYECIVAMNIIMFLLSSLLLRH